MKKIGIFYFSGTGNTRAVADCLVKNLQENSLTVNLIDVSEIVRNKLLIDPTIYDLIGIAYPVYALNAPAIIYEFIRMLPKINVKDLFILRTSGSKMFDGGATMLIKFLLKRKGYKVFNERLVVMPSNVFYSSSLSTIKFLYESAAREMSNMAQEIFLKQERVDKKLNLGVSLLSILLGWQQSLVSRFSSVWLKVNKRCNLCGKCIQQCPVANLYVRDKKVFSRNKCLACMRCVYNCPQKAIEGKLWGKLLVIKKGYLGIRNFVQ